jgi:copper(I)-binding protein
VSRRSLTSVSALVVSAALLAGCGTGLHSRTYRENGREDGAVADVGGRTGLAVRGLHVSAPVTGSTHPAGGTAFVTGGLVNNSTSNDALVGASSDVAGAVTLLVDGTPTTEVAIPAMGAAPSTWSLALSDLAEELHAATYIPVTLEFQRAGRVTLQVPVYAGDNGLQDREAEQEPYELVE